MGWLDINANDAAAGGGAAPMRNGKNLGQDGGGAHPELGYRWESILSLVGQNIGNNRIGGLGVGLGTLTLEEARLANDACGRRIGFIATNMGPDMRNDGVPIAGQTLAAYRACNKNQLHTGHAMVPMPDAIRIYPYESSRAFQKIMNADDE
jgi:hypothetical protein